MSPTFTVILFVVAAFAAAYALCEFALRRMRGAHDDDPSPTG
jgi:hypothetical protein